MEDAILDFISARERYAQLERARLQARTPEERELLHIELMEAWLEVHHRAQIVTGIRFSEHMQFASVN
jgi:hypothetical protein